MSQISIQTVDSDVFTVLLGFMLRFLDINPELELYIDFNTEGNRKNIHINACYQSLGKDICLALPFFHCFSGADSTCSFYKMTKRAWFLHWMSFPMIDELTDSFQKLSWCPTDEALANAQKVIEKCVVYAYSSHIDDGLDAISKVVYERIEEFPPSLVALVLHVSRCAYQDGWVWVNSLAQCTPPPTESWGWRLYEEHLCIKWI